MYKLPATCINDVSLRFLYSKRISNMILDAIRARFGAEEYADFFCISELIDPLEINFIDFYENNKDILLQDKIISFYPPKDFKDLKAIGIDAYDFITRKVFLLILKLKSENYYSLDPFEERLVYLLSIEEIAYTENEEENQYLCDTISSYYDMLIEVGQEELFFENPEEKDDYIDMLSSIKQYLQISTHSMHDAFFLDATNSLELLFPSYEFMSIGSDDLKNFFKKIAPEYASYIFRCVGCETPEGLF